MADTIAKGAVVLQTDGAKLDKDLKAAQSSIMGFAGNIGGLSVFGTGAFGGAIAGIKALESTVTSYVGNIIEMGDKAEQILNMSAAFGITAEEFQTLSNAAKLSGVDIDTFEKGWKELSNTIVGSLQGNEEATKKLANLGLTADMFNGRSVTESFDMVGAAIGRLNTPMERLKAAGDIFGGKSGFKLLPAIGKEFADTMKDVQKYSIDATTLKSLDETADKWSKLGMAVSAAKANFAGSGTSGAIADTLRTSIVDPLNAALYVNNADNGGLTGLMTKGAFGRDILGDNTDYEKVAAKIMSIRKKEAEFRQERERAGALERAKAEAEQKLAADQQLTVNNTIKATDEMAAAIGRTAGELDTWKKAQTGIKGELLSTIEAENKLQDALRAAAPLVKQSPYVTLQQQLAGLDALLAAGRITQDQFFTATAQAGQSIISQSGVQQQQRQNPEMLVAGTNDAIRQALNDRLDMGAKQTPGELLGSAVEKLNENAAKQVEQGAEMVRQLREIAKTKGGTVEVR